MLFALESSAIDRISSGDSFRAYWFTTIATFARQESSASIDHDIGYTHIACWSEAEVRWKIYIGHIINVAFGDKTNRFYQAYQCPWVNSVEPHVPTDSPLGRFPMAVTSGRLDKQAIDL